jgi:hypothetical protein
MSLSMGFALLAMIVAAAGAALVALARAPSTDPAMAEMDAQARRLGLWLIAGGVVLALAALATTAMEAGR